jgi:hypothetical protein
MTSHDNRRTTSEGNGHKSKITRMIEWTEVQAVAEGAKMTRLKQG